MVFWLLLNKNLTAKEAVILFLIMLAVFCVSISVHEFAHALAAYKMGDNTPKLAGRLTINPIKHITPLCLITFIFFGIAWARPVPINPINFKKFRKGLRIVSVAGVLANLILGLIASVIFCILGNTIVIVNEFSQYIFIVLLYFMTVNGCLFMFNILPIFPLDGYNFITTFMHGENKFIKFMVKHGVTLLFGILIASSLIEVVTGVDIFSYYLQILYNFVFLPITTLGV